MDQSAKLYADWRIKPSNLYALFTKSFNSIKHYIELHAFDDENYETAEETNTVE